MSQPLGQIVQIAYVVNDMDKALDDWLKKKITGPFHLIESLEFEDPRYCVVSAEVDIDVALSFSGNMCIELIKQKSSAPSVYKELSDNGGGFHHWGVSTINFEKDVANYQKQGYELAFSASIPNLTRLAYMDTFAEMGGMVELLELTPELEENFKFFEDAAINWDGSDPIRKMN